MAGRCCSPGEPPLTLTRREADRMLLHLPSLRRLELYGTAVPQRVRQYLRAAAPQLQVVAHGSRWDLPDGWGGGLSEPGQPESGSETVPL